MKRKLSLFPFITFIILIFLFSAACGRNTEKTIQSDAKKNMKNENPSKKPETENSTKKNNEGSAAKSGQTTAPTIDEFISDPPVTAENTSLPFVVGAPVVDKQVFDKTDSRVMEALNAYYSVFTGQTNFCFFLGVEAPFPNTSVINISQLKDFISPRELRRFAVIDLDNDNIPEVVLSNGEYEDDFFIFKYQNSHVYVYELGNRSFGGLKIDGTFHWSGGGAASSGTGSLLFEGSITSTYDILKGSHNPVNTFHYVNSEPVTAKEYSEADNYQNNKPDAVWHDYIKENIQEILP